MGSIMGKINDDMNERQELLAELKELETWYDNELKDYSNLDDTEKVQEEYASRKAQIEKRLKELEYLDGDGGKAAGENIQYLKRTEQSGEASGTLERSDNGQVGSEEKSSPLELLEASQEDVLRLILENGIIDSSVDEKRVHTVAFRSMELKMSEVAFMALQSVCELLEANEHEGDCEIDEESLWYKGICVITKENFSEEQRTIFEKLEILDAEFDEQYEEYDQRKTTLIEQLGALSSEWVCRVCGCTDLNACPDGCNWVEPNLCSRCVGLQTKSLEE